MPEDRLLDNQHHITQSAEPVTVRLALLYSPVYMFLYLEITFSDLIKAFFCFFFKMTPWSLTFVMGMLRLRHQRVH